MALSTSLLPCLKYVSSLYHSLPSHRPPIILFFTLPFLATTTTFACTFYAFLPCAWHTHCHCYSAVCHTSHTKHSAILSGGGGGGVSSLFWFSL